MRHLIPLLLIVVLPSLAMSYAEIHPTTAVPGSLSVIDFGANPTGTSDSSDAMQATISAVNASSDINTMYIPCGTYKLGRDDYPASGLTAISFWSDFKDGIKIQGENEQCVFFDVNDAVDNGLWFIQMCPDEEADGNVCKTAATITDPYALPSYWEISGIAFRDQDPDAHQGVGEETHGVVMGGVGGTYRDITCSHMGDECIAHWIARDAKHYNIHIGSVGISNPADAVDISAMTFSGTTATITSVAHGIASTNGFPQSVKITVTGADFDDIPGAATSITIDGREVQMDWDAAHGHSSGNLLYKVEGLTETLLNGTFWVSSADDNPGSGITTYYLPEETCNVISPTAVLREPWATGQAYDVGDIVKPTVANDFWFTVEKAGTTGGTEPTWDTTFRGITEPASSTPRYSAIPDTPCPTTCAGACLTSAAISYDLYNSNGVDWLGSVTDADTITFTMNGTPQANSTGAARKVLWGNGGAGISIQRTIGCDINGVYAKDDSDYASNRSAKVIHLENFAAVNDPIENCVIQNVHDEGFGGLSVVEVNTSFDRTTTGLTVNDVFSVMENPWSMPINTTGGGVQRKSSFSNINTKAPQNYASSVFESSFTELLVDTSFPFVDALTVRSDGGNTFDAITIKNAPRTALKPLGTDPAMKVTNYNATNIGSNGNVNLSNSVGGAGVLASNTDFFGKLIVDGFNIEMNYSGDYCQWGLNVSMRNGTCTNAGRFSMRDGDLYENVITQALYGGISAGIRPGVAAIRNTINYTTGIGIDVSANDVLVDGNTLVGSVNQCMKVAGDDNIVSNNKGSCSASIALWGLTTLDNLTAVDNVFSGMLRTDAGTGHKFLRNRVGSITLFTNGTNVDIIDNEVAGDIQINQSGAGTTDNVKVRGGSADNVLNEAGSTTTEMTNIDVSRVNVTTAINMAGAGVATCLDNIVAGTLDAGTCP